MLFLCLPKLNDLLLTDGVIPNSVKWHMLACSMYHLLCVLPIKKVRERKMLSHKEEIIPLRSCKECIYKKKKSVLKIII